MEVALQWLKNARGVMSEIENTQQENITKAAAVMADAIEKGHWVHTFGCGHATIPIQEMYPRIGGFVGFHPICELPLTFFTQIVGNPFLTPEYSNSIDLTYHGKWHSANVIASVFYNYNKDVIQQYLTPVNPVNGQQSPGIVYNTYKNYGTSYFIGFEAIASGDPLRFLNISGSFNAYYVDYSIGENTFWNKCGVNWNAKLSANIKITDGISAMLLGRYKGRQTYIQGVEDANGTMDAGLRWDFLKKKLSLSARLTDVFDTFSSKTHATIDAGNGALQRELNYENYETRVFYMSLSYRF